MAKGLDLRTYLLLERAFVRRLQRSWRQQSAPTYAAIAQACTDHKWDEARRLVSDLDMTEVGTENREWITYMLLSCAVFGAGTVAKGKPSFVGVGTFDTFLKQVTNNFLMYLENAGTRQVQAEALQSIAEDEAKTKALKREYVRDEKGQFAETGERQLQGDEAEEEEARRTFFHGTAKQRLDSILKEGLRAAHAGEVWEGMSKPGQVYFTLDEEQAVQWAEGRHRSGDHVAVAVLTIKIPPDEVAKLTIDENIEEDPKTAQAWKFKGDIPPEWIIEAKIGEPSDDNVWESDFEWHNVPTKKAASDGRIIYVAVVLVVEKAPGVGGITRKFDEAKHPRGDDGRFIEATQPRIFNRPSEVVQDVSWGETSWRWIDKETGKPSGHILTGEPIPREQIPKVLYHVTTNAPAVESSGVLLGLLESGGLGGGQAQGVSFTTSREDAIVIQRELRRAIQIAKGELDIDVLERWAEEDAKEVGLPKEALAPAVQYARDFWEGNVHSLKGSWVSDPTGEYAEENRGKTFGHIGPISSEEYGRLHRSLMKDTLNAYLQIRGHVEEEGGQRMALLKNPILFGHQEQLAKLDPKNVQILETHPEDIPAEALVTTGSDKFLHEVRVYADVPRRRKKVAYDPHQARGATGTPEGGQFVETGRSGVPTPDPVLAVQAKAGIAAVERLIPEALKTADFSKVPGGWAELTPEVQQKVAKYYEESKYDEVDIQAIDADLVVDVRWELQEGSAEKAAELRAKAKERLAGYFADRPIDLYSLGRGAKSTDEAAEQNKDLRLDMATVHISEKRGNDGHPIIDLEALRYNDGSKPTAFEKNMVREVWVQSHQKELNLAIEKVQDTDEYLAKREAMVRAEVEKRWQRLSDDEKQALLPEMIAGGEFKDTDPYSSSSPGGMAREPKQWMTGIEEGTHEEADYARTHVLTRKLTELRTDELRKERGLVEPRVPPDYTISPAKGVSYNFLVKDANGEIVGATLTHEEAKQRAMEWQEQEVKKPLLSSQELIQNVWQQWIRKSSEGLSLSLQLAAARELGGHHRLQPWEIKEAEESAIAYGGIETLQAYVRAQWEVTQTVMQKSGTGKISVYRGLMLEGETVDNTPNVRVLPSGEPVPKPTNVKVLVDTTVGGQGIKNKSSWPVRETVTFDFEGESFTVLKNREPSPQSWDEVSPEVKEQMVKQWEKQVREVEAEHPGDPRYAFEKGANILDRMSEAGKLQMLQDWRRMGEIPPEPFESTERAINRHLKYFVEERGGIYTKLPDLVLQRAGAQSTTGTADVANDWGGVGNLPENPERVVLRIEAPPTSVLSLPVYGENNQEEHESVLLGTKDKWLWDAWRNQAPTFEVNPVVHAARKAEMKKLVIDLQAEDRGKPHWMSSVDWQSIAAKWDEAKHPRDAQGQFAPYYHGTSNEIAEKILKEGLKPLSEMDRSSPIGKGFASTSEKVAMSYAAMASDDTVDTITVIVFKPEANQYFKPAQKHAGGQKGSWFSARGTEMSSTETVPPEMIQEIRQYRLADVIEAIGPRKGKQYADWESPLEDLDPVSVVRKAEQVYVAIPTRSGVAKYDPAQPRDAQGQFTVAGVTITPPHVPPQLPLTPTAAPKPGVIVNPLSAEHLEWMRESKRTDPVFHTTSEEFAEFGLEKFGQSGFGGLSGLKGVFFTTRYDFGYGPIRYVANIRVTNPLHINAKETGGEPYRAAREQVTAEHDSIAIHWGDGSTEWIVFDPKQARIIAPVQRATKQELAQPKPEAVLKWDEQKHPREPKGGPTGGQFTEGVGQGGEKAPQPHGGTGGSGGIAVPSPAAKAKAGGRPEAVPEVQAVANAYNAKHGLPPVQHDYAKLDEARAGTIADAYDALPLDDSGNPEVRAAYEALATEIRAQFDHIVASGVTFTPWAKEGQPYPDSKTMVDDIRQNKHMFFYTGGDPNVFMAASDPETGLTTNDMFRAVHDYFGHAAGGYGFGPRGEENAWMSHSQMLTPQARRALTTETRGQNSWVNFGRHNYDAEGNHKNIPPQDRPFATQKTALLPEWYALLPGESTLKWDESKHPRDDEGQFTRVAMTSQRPEGDPGHQPNKEVFRHMREFHEQLDALPGVSHVSVKPGVGGWEGGSESMWQIYYKGNGEARKLVARTAKAHNQDAVLILNQCKKGQDCQPAVELSFQDAISPAARENIHKVLVANGIGGWTWMKRNGKTLLRMVCVPQWGGEAKAHQQATAAISQQLRQKGLTNHRRVHKVAVSVMGREGKDSYDAIIGA